MPLHQAKVSFDKALAATHSADKQRAEKALAEKNVVIKLRHCQCVHCLLSRAV